MRLFPRGLDRRIWLLCIAVLLNRGSGFLALFAAIYFASLGLEATQLAGALLVIGASGVVGSIWSGRVSDRLGVRRLLVSTTLVNAVALTGLAVLDGVVIATVMAGVSVFCAQAFVPPASSIIARSAVGEDRVTLFAFFRIFINVGSVIAPATAGLLGEGSFPVLFAISAVTCLVTAVLLSGITQIAAVGEQADHTADEPAGRPGFALWVLLVSMAVTMVIYAQHQSAIPLTLLEREDGMRIFSTLLIINPVLIILIEYPMSHISKKYTWRTALACGVAVMSVGVAVAGVADPVPVIYLGWVLFTVGECLFAPMSNVAVAEISSDADLAKNQGLLAAGQSIGVALGPAVGAIMLAGLGDGTWAAILVAAAALVLAIHLSYVTGRRQPSRPAPSEVKVAP